MRSATQLTSTASVGESGSGSSSSTTLIPKAIPSTGKQKKKKGKRGEGGERKGREKKEKKEETIAVVEEEKKEPERVIPPVADAVPSFNTIMVFVRRMKDAEEQRRLQDEATLIAFAEAEAERGCYT